VREAEVVRVLAHRLKLEGAYPTVRPGSERGPDIEAPLPSGRRVVVEAKGQRGRMRRNESLNRRMAIGEGLLQLLSRWGRSDEVLALAVPYSEGFEQLVRDALAALRHLRIHVVLVDKDGGVWHLGPDAPGFFPAKPSSLVEALDR